MYGFGRAVSSGYTVKTCTKVGTGTNINSTTLSKTALLSFVKRNYTHKVVGVDENLKYFAVKHTQPVFWGDQDSFQHVNNVMYFRFVVFRIFQIVS